MVSHPAAISTHHGFTARCGLRTGGNREIKTTKEETVNERNHLSLSRRSLLKTGSLSARPV